MSVDSIHKKLKTRPTSELRSKSKPKKPFLILIIIIVAVIFVIWLFFLKYNFQLIDLKSRLKTKQDPAGQEINTAIENLSQELEKLKDQKIFSQTENMAEEQTLESDSIDVHGEEPPPAQQY